MLVQAGSAAPLDAAPGTAVVPPGARRGGPPGEVEAPRGGGRRVAHRPPVRRGHLKE